MGQCHTVGPNEALVVSGKQFYAKFSFNYYLFNFACLKFVLDGNTYQKVYC